MLDTYDILIISSSVGALLCLIALINVSQDEYYNAGYKQGQIDVLCGKPKYKLESNKDGEYVWTKIEEK